MPYPAYRHTAQHAHNRHVKPRSVLVTRIMLTVGALLVIVTLGWGGYAVGTALSSSSPAPVNHSSMTHPKQIQPGITPRAPQGVPQVPRSSSAPAPSSSELHALHLWHVLHLHHLAHLAWLELHGVPVQTE